MKPSNSLLLIPLLLVASLCASHAQPATNLQLRLEPRPNALDLVVDGDAAAGAFFIYQAQDLSSLLNSLAVAVQTTTPLTNGLCFSLPATGTAPSQAFFTAAHWPGTVGGGVGRSRRPSGPARPWAGNVGDTPHTRLP